MNDFAVTSTTLAASSIALLLLVIAIIIACKNHLNYRAKKIIKANKTEPPQITARNKYPEVNVFRWSGTFFNFGLSVAIALVILAFNWTSYEEQIDLSDKMWSEEDLMIEIPPTKHPAPPPPPPPPPPVIEEMPEEEMEEEEVIFLDQTIEETTEIADVPIPTAKTPPPPPPPPPAPTDEGPVLFMLIEDKPLFQECEGVARSEQEACFTDHLLKYVYSEVKYPAIARENGIQGNVIVKFVIEKTGKIGAIEILRAPSDLLGDETLRVLNQLKQEVTFIPGMQRKHPVRVQFTMPVKYKLQ